MKNFLLEQQQKEERIAILAAFIQSNPDARELKCFKNKLFSDLQKTLRISEFDGY